MNDHTLHQLLGGGEHREAMLAAGCRTSSKERAYPTMSFVSSMNSYGGISRLSGAGPLRMRPEVS